MKKILLFCCLMLTLTSCIRTVYIDENGNEIPAEDEIYIHEITHSNSPWKLVKVTINGQSHEYIRYYLGGESAIAHWQSCRYCNKTTFNKNTDNE